MPPFLKPLALTTLAIPTSLLLLKAYLYNHPLPAHRSETIIATETVSPTCAASSSIRIVNPRNHIAFKDSYKIHLSKTEIRTLSDEEILARFMKGFYGGWILTPERYLIALLGLFGMKIAAVGFSDIKMNDPELISPLDLSSTTLPPLHSVLFRGNFMLLDKNISAERKQQQMGLAPETRLSYVDIAYGDNRKRFAGIHRFELIRDSETEGSGAWIWYSSTSCNPTANKPVFPYIAFMFHKVYAGALFRDGIAAVISS